MEITSFKKADILPNQASPGRIYVSCRQSLPILIV